MNKKIMTMLAMAVLVFALVPFSAMAMKHGDDKKMNGDMQHQGMSMDSGMAMDDDTIMLHGDKVNGVEVMAHLMDVEKAMAEHGMKMTHHLMVGFKNVGGDEVKEGRVAVKIERPDGSVSEPVPMMSMDGEFGADITLDQKGMYHFMVGTKLKDGQKRTFHIHHEIK